MRHISVTRSTVDPGADMWRVHEPDVGLRRIAVHALPGQIEAARLECGDLFDSRRVGRGKTVAIEAEIHTGQPGSRAAPGVLVAFKTRQPLLDVCPVGE